MAERIAIKSHMVKANFGCRIFEVGVCEFKLQNSKWPEKIVNTRIVKVKAAFSS